MSYLWDIYSGYATRSGKYKTDLERKFINRFLEERTLRILDIGGGSGRFAVPLAEIGNLVTVVEPNIEAINISKTRNNSIHYINGTFENYNCDVKFDLILAIEVLGFFSSTEFFIEKAKNLLAVNGLLILSTSNTGSIKYILKQYLYQKEINGYTDLKTYKQIFLKYNLELIDIKGLNWLPFKVNSNSILVPLCKVIINFLFLNYFLKQSPELLICVKNKIR